MPAFFLFFFHIQPKFYKTNFNTDTRIKIKMYTNIFQTKLQFAMTKKVHVTMFQQGPTVIAFLPKTEFPYFATWYKTNKYENSLENNNSNNLQLLLLGGFFFEKNKSTNTYNAYYLSHYLVNQTLKNSSNFKTNCFLFEHQFINIFENLIFQKYTAIANLISTQYYYMYTTLLQKKLN